MQEVARALDETAEVLKSNGATVQDVTLPALTDFAAVNRTIMYAEAWSIHARWLRERPGDYGRLTRQRLMTGAFLSAGDYVDAMRRRKQLIIAVEDAFKSVDVLLTANAMDPACRIDDEKELARTYPRQARTPFNVTGHPALALMGGLSRLRLPLSFQLIG